MVTTASGSKSDKSDYSDYSVNSGYDTDVGSTPKVPGMLSYQYEPMTVLYCY